jgi:hypothetical protein
MEQSLSPEDSRHMKNRKNFYGLVLFVSIFAGQLTAQNQHAVVVTADQPNVWTLEQAHYLLAQMHRRNLDLKATGLGTLDPNEIHGINVDVLKTLLQVSAEFDEAKGFTNSILKDQKSFNSKRRMQLLDRRAKLQDEYSQLTRQKADVLVRASQTTDEEERKRLEATANEIGIVQTAITQQIEQIDAELGTNGPASGDFQSVAPSGSTFNAAELNGGNESVFDDAVKKALESFNSSPKLNASLRLENYLQMQYEILSKQLTLLRDEVGPGERLLFLEMPQSIRSTYDKSDKKWAQSWWKIRAFTRCKEGKVVEEDEDEPERVGGRTEILETSSQDVNRASGCSGARPGYADTSDTIALITGSGVQGAERNDQFEVIDLDEDKTESANSPLKPLFDKIRSEYKNVQGPDSKPLYPYLENREARIVDLFPRQSSLNVNEIKHRTYNMSLRFVFNLLLGFGGNGDYKRSRERYSQFVQQELYSAGFGKGGREFGWTFYPMPGTKRVSSGTRTTYAIMVVPDRANTILLQSTGCYYDRSDRQIESFKEALEYDTEGRLWKKGRCSEPRTFIVPIPTAVSGENVFWVERIDYNPVPAGRRITVSIRGRDFSSQTGILIDGIPLRPSLGLGQPFILDDSATAEKVTDTGTIKGSFERVASNQLIASFEMGPDYTNRTPQITLIAPGKALLLNRERIRVNRYYGGLEDQNAPNMFGEGTRGEEIASISKPAIFQEGGNLVAIVQGKNLDKVTSVYANGVRCRGLDTTNPAFLRCVFPAVDVPTITLTLLGDDFAVQSAAITNPSAKKEAAATTGAAAEPIKYETSDNFEADDGIVLTIRKKPNTLDDYVITYKITGKGFTKDTKPDKGTWVFQSPKSAKLILDWSQYSEILGLAKDKETPKLKTSVFLPVPDELKPRVRRNRP